MYRSGSGDTGVYRKEEFLIAREYCFLITRLQVNKMKGRNLSTIKYRHLLLPYPLSHDSARLIIS
jgi:hypothetical protein